ncbi:citrate/2-methylcitrate synthase [Halobacillus naozhouensis]|uniref:Citrate/2-methylcitrate synthase n=1 Tax=Halobacillus naozhouensis TaxID=554880 RepID=A0ABY8ISU6_9BACI|nr:citrate/2-methylcitrate synthase [Halobacillus naozhouensis]WFT73004.1 citrate/2-methylcitrate synthase [Halobacillus naozhouensis]
MFNPGLKGVTAVETCLSQIDGKKGDLYYRDHSVHDLAGRYSFEEVSYFLIKGEMPDANELRSLKKFLLKERSISSEIKQWIEHLVKKQSITATIRSAVSFLDESEDQWPIQTYEAFRLLAKLPTIVAYSYRKKWLNDLKPGRKLYANVEYYAASLMKAVRIPAELFTPIFCCSRIVGWTAHIIEQSKNNTIFRPEAKYLNNS